MRFLHGKALVNIIAASYALTLCFAGASEALGRSLWFRIPMFICAGITGIGVGLIFSFGLKGEWNK